MKPLHITWGRKMRYIRYLAWFAIILGAFFIVVGVKEILQTGEWEEWFILFEGVFYSIWGFMAVTGHLTDPVIGLNIDDEGIGQEKARGEEKSVHWNEVKNISLELHHIRFQYQSSGEYDKIKLPHYSYKQFQQLKARLGEAAETYGLKYEMI